MLYMFYPNEIVAKVYLFNDLKNLMTSSRV